MSFLKRFATPLALITFTCSVFATTNAFAKGRETDCGDIAISLLGKCKVFLAPLKYLFDLLYGLRRRPLGIIGRRLRGI